VTKAITAPVIAILNVNIRFRSLAHCSSKAKTDRIATPRGLWWPTVCAIDEGAKANLAPFARHSLLMTLAKLRF
jgi:hypothetical protein